MKRSDFRPLSKQSVCQTALTLVVAAFAIQATQARDIVRFDFSGVGSGLPPGFTEPAESDDRNGTSINGGVIADVNANPEGENGPKLMTSPTFEVFPAGSNQTTLEIEVDAFTGDSIAIIRFEGSTHAIGILFDSMANTIAVIAFDPSDPENTAVEVTPPTSVNYTSGTLFFFLTLEAVRFRVREFLTNFDSGFQTYSGTGLPGFDSVTDLGPARVKLGVGAEHGIGTATAEFDGFTYRTDAPPLSATPENPVKVTLEGKVKKLQKRLKKAKSNPTRAKRIRERIKRLKKRIARL